MAVKEHTELIHLGYPIWNEWRSNNPDIVPDLSNWDLAGAYLANMDLTQANFEKANLKKAVLSNSILHYANLSSAVMEEAVLDRANLSRANLSGANLVKSSLSYAILQEAILTNSNLREARVTGGFLRNADLSNANLANSFFWKSDFMLADLTDAVLVEAILADCNFSGTILRSAQMQHSTLDGARFKGADLQRANLSGASLRYVTFADTDLTGARIKTCPVYGISVWNPILDETTIQEDLVVTPEGQPEITVDNLEVAQFIYMITNNKKIAGFISAMRTKNVLLLGSFKRQYKEVLEVLRKALSSKGYVTTIFDFDTNASCFPLETIKTLALLSAFVIVDLSEPAGQYVEMGSIENTPVPIIRIAECDAKVTTMLNRPHHWISSEIFRYDRSRIQNEVSELVVNHLLPSAEKINKEFEVKRQRQE